MRKLLPAIIFLTFTLATLNAAEISRGIFNVRDFGAKGDGVQLDTQAIQAAIDSCSNAGGGKVILANGRFLSGTLYLKGNVTLYIEAGAVLLGSQNLADYPVTKCERRTYTENYTDKSLIYAEKVNNVGIMGHGTINGQGTAFSGPYKVRPYMIRIIDCNNVTVKDVTMTNSPMWVQHYLACDNVTIDGITVDARRRHVNNDGIDIDCCHRVRISNCWINSGDDAIVLKATSNQVCRDVAISNCVLSSATNIFKLGTESNGGFQNVTLSNCTFYNSPSGIALEEVDGGYSNRIIVANVVMDSVKNPIFIRLGNRARPITAKGPGGSKGTFTVEEGTELPGVGSLQNVIISNVIATNCGSTGGSITGLEDHAVENVTLENIRIYAGGGGTLEDAAKEVPELPKAYPRVKMFGTLPAYGFFCRHVKNLRLSHIELYTNETDHRPPVIFDDVIDLSIFDLDAQTSSSAAATLWLKDVKNAFIHGCHPTIPVRTLIKIGRTSTSITIADNDFAKVDQIVTTEKGFSKKELFLKNNRK